MASPKLQRNCQSNGQEEGGEGQPPSAPAQSFFLTLTAVCKEIRNQQRTGRGRGCLPSRDNNVLPPRVILWPLFVIRRLTVFFSLFFSCVTSVLSELMLLLVSCKPRSWMISASMFWSFLVLVITYSSIIQAVKGSPWSSFSCSRMILRFGAIRFASSFLMQVLLYRILDLRIHLVLMHRVCNLLVPKFG